MRARNQKVKAFFEHQADVKREEGQKKGEAKKRRMKKTDIATECRTERPPKRGRGQTKRTWLTHLVAIICDQERG